MLKSMKHASIGEDITAITRNLQALYFKVSFSMQKEDIISKEVEWPTEQGKGYIFYQKYL